MADTITSPTIDLTDSPSPRGAERKVPTRRISFEESLRDLPKHFAADGDLILSHLAASLSAVFPDGEDFFVRSVRHYRGQITDPELKRQVAGFIGQEAMHGREHRAFNDRLAELGYPTKPVERFTRKGLAIREKVAPPMSNLAATAALEHFTATLAELLLTDEDARGLFGDEAVREPVPLARPRGVRAQGRRLRRLQGGRRQRAPAGLDDEGPPLRLRRRHGRAGRAVAARATGRPTSRAGSARAGARSGARRS